MTNPLSHKCENYSEPDQLRGDLYSKNNVSKYKQLLILSINLQIIVPSSSGIAFFSFRFSNDIYKCLNVASGDEFFLQKIWALKTQW